MATQTNIGIIDLRRESTIQPIWSWQKGSLFGALRAESYVEVVEGTKREGLWWHMLADEENDIEKRYLFIGVPNSAKRQWDWNKEQDVLDFLFDLYCGTG